MSEKKETLTPEQSAIAKATNKPGLAVGYNGGFFIKNKSTGKMYRLMFDAKAKVWNVTDEATGKVVATKKTRSQLRRIVKDWTPKTEGVIPTEEKKASSGAAKTTAAAKKGGDGTGTGTAKKTAAPKKNSATAEKKGKPGQRMATDFIPNDAVVYSPKAGSGKYSGRVVKVGPNKLQVAVQMAAGARPQTLWVPREEIKPSKSSPAPDVAAATAA